jgi:hypothetical protein
MLRPALLLAIALTQTACAKGPDPICQELDATIDDSIRRVAMTMVEGDIYDKGAMQQAARYISANNHLQVIRISLDLQSQHKCQIRKSVINPFMYEAEATKCMLASAGGDGKENKDSLCDPKNWKGNSR